jgi:hypothetical protein
MGAPGAGSDFVGSALNPTGKGYWLCVIAAARFSVGEEVDETYSRICTYVSHLSKSEVSGLVTSA